MLFSHSGNGVGTIAPEENYPPDSCLLDDSPWIIVPGTIAPEDNCPRGKLTPGKLPPQAGIILK